VNRRRLPARAALAAIGFALASAAIAAPAQASIGISSFSLTPSTTQAGGTSSSPGPNLVLDAKFSTSNADTPKDATIALATGLLANPSVVPLCPTSDFQAGFCPDSSRIGQGYVTGTAPEFGLTLNLPTDAYLIQPQGSEPARVGLIVTFFDFPVATQSAPVTIRSSPDVGIDIPLTGLPNDLDGVPAIIDGLHLTIFGSVNGTAFTRNPTACSAATSSLTVDSYGDSTQHTSTSSFTPTGCGSLPYAPTIAGSVSKDASDDGIALQATVTQQYDEADDQSIELTFPFSASPRLSAFANGCTNADITTCPSVGTATIATPLLTNPLQANVVLVAHSGALPTVAILVPQPFGIELDATPILTGSSVQALVTDVPDIPISSLTLNLPGGPNSLFRAGVHLCTDAQTWGGNFTAWSGATASPTSAASVTGCPGSAASAPAIAPPAHQKPALASGPSGRSSSATGLVRYFRHRITVALGAGRRLRKLRSVSIRIPRGLSIDLKTIAVKLDGHSARATAVLKRGLLTITFARPGRVVFITLRTARRSAQAGLSVKMTGTSGLHADLRIRP
jgi:hypothetical protein